MCKCVLHSLGMTDLTVEAAVLREQNHSDPNKSDLHLRP